MIRKFQVVIATESSFQLKTPLTVIACSVCGANELTRMPVKDDYSVFGHWFKNWSILSNCYMGYKQLRDHFYTISYVSISFTLTS